MRNARLTLNAVHEMRELGVALVCKDEPIDTRQHGISDMFLAILATLAEWESDRLSEYSKATYQRLVAKGEWPSGSPPFGYDYDKESRSLTVNPERAEIVRLIFSLYVNQHIGDGPSDSGAGSPWYPGPERWSGVAQVSNHQDSR